MNFVANLLAVLGCVLASRPSFAQENSGSLVVLPSGQSVFCKDEGAQQLFKNAIAFVAKASQGLDCSREDNLSMWIVVERGVSVVYVGDSLRGSMGCPFRKIVISDYAGCVLDTGNSTIYRRN